jgi:hypothetical protein
VLLLCLFCCAVLVLFVIPRELDHRAPIFGAQVPRSQLLRETLWVRSGSLFQAIESLDITQALLFLEL